MRRALALPFAVLVACGSPGLHTRAAGAISPLLVEDVNWNPTGEPVGHVRAVAELGDRVAVLGDAGATLLAAGAPVQHARQGTGWVSAGVAPAIDGTGRWLYGVGAFGNLFRLRGGGDFEDVTGRYGVADAHVRAVAALDGQTALLLDGAVAVANGRVVVRTPTPGLTTLDGRGSKLVGVASGGIEVIDVSRRVARRFDLDGARWAVITANGSLFAATARAIYRSEGDDPLRLVFDAGGDRVRGIAASGDSVWFVDRGELGLVRGERVAETAGANLGDDARVFPSPTGAVWLFSRGILRKLVSRDESVARSSWERDLAPVFARACASCHLPGGQAGVDLSSSERWASARTAIDRRVVREKTMPPAGHALPDADRKAIERWIAESSNR